jgi:hypothetical protein
MKDDTKTKLEAAIVACASKAEKAENALEAMQFAQATLNLSNVIIGLRNHLQ